MGLAHALHPLGGGEQAQEADVVRPPLLQQVHRRGRGVARRQHRVHHQHRPVGEVGGHLAVILHRLQRRLVAIEPHEAHARGRGQLQDPVQQPVPRPQDRDQRQLLAGQHRGAHLGQGRVDGDLGQRQVLERLVAQQQRDLAQELAERGGRGRLLPHQGQLVLHQRVLDDGEMLGRCGDGHGRAPADGLGSYMPARAAFVHRAGPAAGRRIEMRPTGARPVPPSSARRRRPRRARRGRWRRTRPAPSRRRRRARGIRASCRSRRTADRRWRPRP